MSYPPHWFTAAARKTYPTDDRTPPRQLHQVLEGTPYCWTCGVNSTARERITLTFWRCSYSSDSSPEQGNSVQLSRKGRRARSLNPANSRRELAEALLGSGYLYSQVRRVIEQCRLDSDGSAHLQLSTLRESAPQVLGLLRAWPGVVGPSMVVIPPVLVYQPRYSVEPHSAPPRPDDGMRKAVGSPRRGV